MNEQLSYFSLYSEKYFVNKTKMYRTNFRKYFVDEVKINLTFPKYFVVEIKINYNLSPKYFVDEIKINITNFLYSCSLIIL